MANDVVIRFISQDGVSSTAMKIAGSLNTVAKSGKNASDATESLGSVVGKIGAAAGLATLGTQLVSIGLNSALVADKFETVRKSLGLMTGSTQAGNDLYNVMEDLAARTPFTFDDISQGTQKLLAMGFTAKEIPGIMTAIGDASSAVGGGAEGVNRITLALGQMQAKGKITTEEMMQLQEMGVPAFRILAEATGVSQQALMEMVSKGIIPAEQNLQTLIAGMEQNYGGMMAQQMDTATQAQSNFQDATDKATQALGEISGPAVKTAFNWMTQALSYATTSMQDFGNWLDWADQSLIRWQMHLRGATEAEVAGALAMRDSSAVTKEHTQDTYALQRVYGSMTGATSSQTTALNINTSATRSNSASTNQLAADETKLKTATDSLKTSFLNIADAQRAVTRTREALEDATNPDTLQSYQNAADRAYYSNQLLTNEITRMGARQRIVREQLRKGNLSQEDRIALQNEDAQITEELIGKNIDLKDSIISLNKSQKDLDRARDPARIQEYADAHTNALLRLDELDAKQQENIDTIGDLNVKLGANVDVMGLVGQAAALTATPMDGLNLAGTNINKTYGAVTGVNSVLTATSLTVAAIGQTSSTAATGLTSVGNAITGLSAVDPAKVSGISTLAGSFSNLGSAASALKSIDFGSILGGVSAAAATLTAATVTQWGALGVSLNAVAAALAAINKANKEAGTGNGGGNGGGNDGGDNGGGTGTGEQEIRNRIQTAFQDKFLSLNEYNTVQGYASSVGIAAATVDTYIKEFLSAAGSSYTTYNKPVFGQIVGPRPIVGGVDGTSPIAGGTPVSQTINITLNYASPPDSKNPLKDVEDYIAAQGGLIRI